MEKATPGHWPAEIRLANKGGILHVAFVEGRSFELRAEYLRVSSPSAEVKGHSPSQRHTQSGKLHVRVADVIAVGNYAIRLVFDDGHETGIFTWDYLYELGDRETENWSGYLAELAQKNLRREP